MMFEDIITADAGRKFKLCGSRSAAENEYNEYGVWVIEEQVHCRDR